MISLIAVLGLVYGNPTREWRHFISNIILFSIGIGSFLLHATLQALPQSSDELPMLWSTITFLYCLVELRSPKGKPVHQYLPLLFTLFAVGETYIYYKYQSYYAVFLVSFISITAAITILSAIAVRDKSIDAATRSSLTKIWIFSLYSFVIVGAGLWILDMNFCPYLLPYYKMAKLGNMTFHVIWHITAGYGAYLFNIYVGAMRVHALKYPTELKWVLGFVPIWKQLETKKK